MPLEEETLFAGVDGGASHTHIVLIDGNGHQLAEADGPPTNIYQTDHPTVYATLTGLVRTVLDKAGYAGGIPLRCLALALSGAEDEQRNQQFAETFLQTHPTVTEQLIVRSDSVGALMTAFDGGAGVVLVAGTGTSCRSISPDGKMHGVGGWGHLLGDEGSAYWITMRAIRRVLTADDQTNDWHGDGELIERKLLQHFGLDRKEDLLDMVYCSFNKSRIASFCHVLADLNDPAVLQIFHDAGKQLGKFLRATATQWKISKFDKDFRMPVLLVGKVWNSLDKMRRGFIEGLKPRHEWQSTVCRLALYQLTTSTAYGMAIHAARRSGYDIQVDGSTLKRLVWEISCQDFAK